MDDQQVEQDLREIVRIATSIIRTAGGDADLNGTVHATGALRL